MSEATETKSTAERLDPHTIVGKYFHTFDDKGCVVWQGRVVGREADGIYVVLLYDWIVGGETGYYLTRLNDMAASRKTESGALEFRWKFYDTAEDMNYAYQYVHRFARERMQED